MKMRSAWEIKFRAAVVAALKIGCGSAIAILAATLLSLPTPSAAGTITLLTICAKTRKGTVQLIIQRLLSFVIAVLLCVIVFSFDHSEYSAYAIFLILIVFILEMLGWQATLSVNALIGMHFMSAQDFSFQFILNEFWLLLIGIAVALALNLMQPIVSEREHLYRSVQRIEKELSEALRNVSAYLQTTQTDTGTWKSVRDIEDEIALCIREAAVFSQNAWIPGSDWFSAYFETRLHQCMIVSRLHEQCRQLRTIPANALIVSRYVESLADCVSSTCMPTAPLRSLDKLIAKAGATSDFGAGDFASKALLYHMLLDMREYVEMKATFISSLSVVQKRQYEHKDRIGLRIANGTMVSLKQGFELGKTAPAKSGCKDGSCEKHCAFELSEADEAADQMLEQSHPDSMMRCPWPKQDDDSKPQQHFQE